MISGGVAPQCLESYVLKPRLILRHWVISESTETRSSGMPVSSARPSTVRALSDALANLVLSFDAEPGSSRSLASGVCG